VTPSRRAATAAAWLATALLTACGLVVDYDFQTADDAGNGAAGGGAAGAGGSGATSTGGAGPGGAGGSGGVASIGWTHALEGDATVTSISVDQQSGDVYLAGLARGPLALGPHALLAPDGGFQSSFVARLSASGEPLALVALATRAAQSPLGSFVAAPGVSVRADGGAVFVSTTSEASGDVPVLQTLGSEHHGSPYAAFGRLDAPLEAAEWTVTCEVGQLKNAEVGVSANMAVAVFGGLGTFRCDSSPATLVDSTDSEGLLLVQADPVSGAGIGLPTLVAGPHLQSAPSVAILGTQRAIVGHFDQTITDGSVTLDWDGPDDLGVGGYGAFAKTYGPDSLRYVGRVSEPPYDNGRLRIAARGDRFVIAHQRPGAVRGVRVLTLSPPAGPVEVATIDSATDEVGTGVAVDGDGSHALLTGALGVSFVAGSAMDGVLDDSLLDHSAGCGVDDAELNGDAFWAVLGLDASFAFVAARAYGDCAPQDAIGGDFDADGNVVVTGHFQGTLRTESGEVTTASKAIWVSKAARTW
jgi:hypothetical protein